ncbi:hypothetical protein SKAU_G00247690 [Synaphobranchus kaupii]|uniref:Uncharacterized protein n=1 Tax=Synaphobranchus kaupii TaxID=118154 RepID=A0A9Q1IPH6_SYNKA|nr:hypothetical protein SKAU_G00247690 [Synaphobranchus kaupii]
MQLYVKGLKGPQCGERLLLLMEVVQGSDCVHDPQNSKPRHSRAVSKLRQCRCRVETHGWKPTTKQPGGAGAGFGRARLRLGEHLGVCERFRISLHPSLPVRRKQKPIA